MSLFGRNVQSVTANSTTTAESTTGAPLQTFAQVKGGKTGTITTPAHDPNSHYGNTSPGSRANVDVLMYGNDTPSAFINSQAVGVFGVTPTQMSNNITNNSAERPAHAGWVLRRAGSGPVIGGTVTNNGSYFANGETITVSNATTNATFTISTNATGNMTSVSVSGGGSGFTNTAVAAIAFNRQRHVANVKSSGGNSYNNADILTVSNTNALVNAVFQISTNSAGGIVNTQMLGANTLNVGLFPNTQTNAGVTFAITNSTGGTAAGNVTTTSLSANLISSSDGTVTLTLGGRAGRVHTETLVAAGSLGAQSAAYGTAATSNGLNAGTTSQNYYPGL